MILAEKKPKILDETYAEILHEIRLGYWFKDSQKNFNSEILKIHVKMWFTFYFI